MIQRIQTVYLFIAAVLVAVACFFPLAHCHVGSGFYSVSALGVESNGVAEFEGSQVWMWVATAFAALAFACCIAAIFGYKDRIGQMKKCVFAILSILVYYILFGIEVYTLFDLTTVFPDLGLVAELPLIAIILIFMAGRAIKRDEDLVRSTDRIR